MNKEEDSEYHKLTEMIRNMPVTCAYCGAKHNKDNIQYIEVYPGRNEPVCNINCAIDFAKREFTRHIEISKTLQISIQKLVKERDKK